MFASLRRLFTSRPARKAVKATYDAASRNPESVKHWKGADYLSADHGLLQSVRRTIASRARFELANNGYASGIVDTLSLHVVGTGPRLQLTPATHDNTIAEMARGALDARERRWQQWAQTVALPAKLKMARFSRCCDGEVFILKAINPKSTCECKLWLTLYEAQQVRSLHRDLPERDTQGRTRAVDGIEYDIYGNPTRYFLSPDVEDWGFAMHGDWYKASSIIHYANIVRPGQHRGVSELAPTLCVFNDLRRYTNAVLASAETAAEVSFIVETDLCSHDEDGNPVMETPGAGTVVEFARNSGVMLPQGWKASQLKSEQPTTQYDAYIKAKVREAARTLSMPLTVALGDSSGYNYASGRLDHQIYYRKVENDRREMERVILNDLLHDFEELDAAMHPADYQYPAAIEWMWDGFEHVDPQKEANAQAQRLQNGTTSLAIECAKEGYDWAQIAEQRAREKALLESLGLPATATITPQNTMNQGDNNDEQ